MRRQRDDRLGVAQSPCCRICAALPHAQPFRRSHICLVSKASIQQADINSGCIAVDARPRAAWKLWASARLEPHKQGCKTREQHDLATHRDTMTVSTAHGGRDQEPRWLREDCQHRDKNGPGTGLKRGQLG
jgi:hypothetical protein